MTQLAAARDVRLAGWIVVAVSFLALAAAQSTRAALGLAMPLWEAEFGWSRSLISGAAAGAFVVTALVAPVVGNAVDRFGARTILLAGLLVLGAAMGLIGAGVDEAWLFVLLYCVGGGLGFGVVAVHVVSTIVAHAFEKDRGLATGVATSGSTAGQLLVVPLLAAVIVTVGWRASYLAMAAASLALAGLVAVALPKARARAAGAAPEPILRRLAALARAPVFHLLFWSFFICGFTTAGVVETHLMPFATFCGFTPNQGALAYGVLAAVNLCGMVFSGWLTDRMNRPLLLGSIYAVRGLSFLLLMNVGNDLSLLLGFAVLFGVFDYSTVPPTASLVASNLGLRLMGLAMGLLSAGHALGAAAGAFLAGWLFDQFAQYDWAWSAALALAMAAALMAFAIREDRGRTAVPAPA